MELSVEDARAGIVYARKRLTDALEAISGPRPNWERYRECVMEAKASLPNFHPVDSGGAE